ncbi:Mycobactin import ATP-binding/permease protein IrtB [Dirofilaria immitis]
MDANAIPKLNHSPLRTSITSDPSPLNIISDSVEVPKSHPRGTVTEISHATPTTRFTSLRDKWGNQKVSDGSDDDLRGEESSRILSPSWNEDHIYSTLYNSEQRSTAHRLGENSASYYNPASRYSSGVAFENSYSGYGNRHNDLKAKEKASPSYGKIFLMLLFIVTALIFVFFVMQNYAELERGEGNKEEF